MTVDQARKTLLSLPNAEEKEHHGHPDFRVNNKIFATLWPADGRAVIRLPSEIAEQQERDHNDRCRIVSRSGGMGWLSMDLKGWTAKDLKPLAELAHSLIAAAKAKKR